MDRMLKMIYPGELMRLALRTRFVDDEVRAGVSDAATQLLILGAGFDTEAFGWPRASGTYV